MGESVSGGAKAVEDMVMMVWSAVCACECSCPSPVDVDINSYQLSMRALMERSKFGEMGHYERTFEIHKFGREQRNKKKRKDETKR